MSDAEAEFSDLSHEAARLSEFLARLDHGNLGDDTLETWVAAHTCGSSSEGLCMGMERVMLLLATRIDGVPMANTASWHLGLLRRMGEPVEGRRGAVLTPSLCAALDRLCGFRHRERNSYAADLRPVTVIERAEEALATLARFFDAVRTFLQTRSP
ncbi:hypothetical protein ACE7GA_18325 [Roseomonas sp. CCTCC AB2023176]|uniref:ribonuclease toxin HepT-like protein n=1 Tax=Roseomonas sp. CCTCC AB2023176 TaxID=3342640 RepID=UPI0035DEAD37